MLTCLTKAVRNWVATGFVALYAVCLVAPTAALAFNGASCLTEHSISKAHSLGGGAHKHGGDAAHHHDDRHDHTGPVDNHDDGSAKSKCCGMVFCSALAPDLALALEPPVLTDRSGFAVMQDFTGLPPYKLIRPPKSQS